MRFAILGNSGSGKSTLAKWLGESARLPVLDLDSVAWEPDQPGVPRPADAAEIEVARYCADHPSWIIEGCYANLIAAALPFRPVLIFLEPGLDQCTANCLNRPWEPHKYPSKEDQDSNLEFLLSWVGEYYTRTGEMSLLAHEALFAQYDGSKMKLLKAPNLDPPDSELLALLQPPTDDRSPDLLHVQRDP